MRRVRDVFPNRIERHFGQYGIDYGIDYYYDISEKSLVLLLRGDDEGPYYRVTFTKVHQVRSIMESWALWWTSLDLTDFPDESRLGTIYELLDGDVIWPLAERPQGRHFYIFAENYNLDIYAEDEPIMEEISEEDSFHPKF